MHKGDSILLVSSSGIGGFWQEGFGRDMKSAKSSKFLRQHCVENIKMAIFLL